MLVNLNGYFGDERTRVFARRAAPIQVNYLGFPGTLWRELRGSTSSPTGTSCPTPDKAFYAEKVAYLPNSYQANDNIRPIASRSFDRADCGLPAQGDGVLLLQQRLQDHPRRV